MYVQHRETEKCLQDTPRFNLEALSDNGSSGTLKETDFIFQFYELLCERGG